MSDRPIPVLARAARDVLAVLEDASIPACLIGGVAVQRWGEPRATIDVDLTAVAAYGEEARVLDILLQRFRPRRPDARAFAEQHRVLLIENADGVPLDVALAAFPFEIEAIDGASSWEIAPGVSVRTCPAEHLLIYKLVAARPRDLADIEGIVRRQRQHLDVSKVRAWGAIFAELKDDPDLLRPFEAALGAQL